MLNVASRVLIVFGALLPHLLMGSGGSRPVKPAETAGFIRVSTLPAGLHAMKTPSGIGVVLPDGRLVVADRGRHQVRILQPNGETALVIGSGNPGFRDGALLDAKLNEPVAVAVNSHTGVLYVSERGNHAIRTITMSGEVTTLAGSGRAEDRDGIGRAAGFKQPAGLAIDAAGVLYVADAGNHKIRRVTTDGTVATVAGVGRPGYFDTTPAETLFSEPQGVAVAADGNLYVADTGNHVIRRISASAITTVAGTGRPGRTDGAAQIAEFKFPVALAVHHTGDLFVSDLGNHQIRRVSAGSTPVVSTIAGNGTP